MSIGNISPKFDRESFECSSCREDHGYMKCSVCRGEGVHCKVCGGSGKVKCLKCKGHGRTGEFAGTTLDI